MSIKEYISKNTASSVFVIFFDLLTIVSIFEYSSNGVLFEHGRMTYLGNDARFILLALIIFSVIFSWLIIKDFHTQK